MDKRLGDRPAPEMRRPTGNARLHDASGSKPLTTTPADTHRFYGRHVIAELYRVPEALLADAGRLEAALVEATVASGATVERYDTVQFTPYGSTTCVILSESHASIHSYPEHSAIFLDAFTCGAIDPLVIFQTFRKEIDCTAYEVMLIHRGHTTSGEPQDPAVAPIGETHET